jgi:hypothetical protein
MLLPPNWVNLAHHLHGHDQYVTYNATRVAWKRIYFVMENDNNGRGDGGGHMMNSF